MRPSPPLAPRRSRLSSAAVLIGFALLATGCSSISVTPAGFIDDMPKAWAEDTSDFPRELPAGIEWPASPPATLLEEDTDYQIGTSTMMAAHYWLCAWEDVYLTSVREKDEEAAAAALVNLDAFPSLPMVQTYVENADQWHEGVVTPATVNHLTPLTQDFDGGCAFYREEQITPKENN